MTKQEMEEEFTKIDREEEKKEVLLEQECVKPETTKEHQSINRKEEAFKEITSLIITLVASNVEATAKEMQKMYIFYSILAFGLGIIIGRRI